MDPAELNPWVLLLAGLFGVGGTIWNIFSKPGARAQEEVKKVGEKIDKLEERISLVEAEMKHLPDRDSTHRLELAIAKLEGRFDAFDERLTPVTAMATRFQDYMLKGH